MRVLGVVFFVLLFLPNIDLVAGGKSKWQEIKKKHFIIYYVGNSRFAQRIGRKAEEYYAGINSDFGFTRHDGFWLWEKRAKIYIYSSRENFAKAVGAPEWAAGKADPEQRVIATYEGSADFVDSLLPHEMTHLIFMEFVGVNKSIPLWLNEGVAQWEDKLYRDRYTTLVGRLYTLKLLIPLEELVMVDTGAVDDRQDAIVFYAQSVSLVGFMMKNYGSDRFRKFCGKLRDGKTINDALRFTYPSEISTIELLENSWRSYLEERK